MKKTTGTKKRSWLSHVSQEAHDTSFSQEDLKIMMANGRINDQRRRLRPREKIMSCLTRQHDKSKTGLNMVQWGYKCWRLRKAVRDGK